MIKERGEKYIQGSQHLSFFKFLGFPRSFSLTFSGIFLAHPFIKLCGKWSIAILHWNYQISMNIFWHSKVLIKIPWLFQVYLLPWSWYIFLLKWQNKHIKMQICSPHFQESSVFDITWSWQSKFQEVSNEFYYPFHTGEKKQEHKIMCQA